jgi:hypothetical protein
MESFSKKQNLLKITVPQHEILSVGTLSVGTLLVGTLPVEILSEECQEFLNSLDDKHLKSYFIAKSHLGSSFDLEKSNSFLHWKKNRLLIS